MKPDPRLYVYIFKYVRGTENDQSKEYLLAFETFYLDMEPDCLHRHAHRSIGGSADRAGVNLRGGDPHHYRGGCDRRHPIAPVRDFTRDQRAVVVGFRQLVEELKALGVRAVLP